MIIAVFGYTRVSTTLQAEEGDSLEAQKKQIIGYALSREFELNEKDIFVEAGVSGSIEFELRPEGKKLYDSLQSGDLIIFPKLDRAFRNTRNALNILHEFRARGISIHFIDLGGDVTGNGIGAIIFTILSAFATFERERIASRIREVKDLKRTQGKFLGGRPAFGYLLRQLEITRSNHVWAADITYIPMKRGFVYLFAVIDWASRRVLSWRLWFPYEEIVSIQTWFSESFANSNCDCND